VLMRRPARPVTRQGSRDADYSLPARILLPMRIFISRCELGVLATK
jgi:hypothetical protein